MRKYILSSTSQKLFNYTPVPSIKHFVESSKSFELMGELNGTDHVGASLWEAGGEL